MKQAYEVGAVAFAKAYKPEYLGFGIEINALHETNPADYASFKVFFAKVVKVVKQVSPDTKVFTVFQLERLRGLRGGLFGGKNNSTINDWVLLGDFPDADLLAFTTYPCIVYNYPPTSPPTITQQRSHNTPPNPSPILRLGGSGSASLGGRVAPRSKLDS